LDSHNKVEKSNAELIFIAGQNAWWPGWIKKLEEILSKGKSGKVEDR